MTKKIIIDPGHGGKDGGGGSNSNFLEKDMTLKISLEQRRLLRILGIETKMTRTTDVYLSPDKRTDIVKNSGCKYCISNHVNSYTSSAIGAEVAHSIHSNGKWAKLTLDELVKAGAHRRRVFTRRHPSLKNKDYYYMHRDTGSVETIIAEHNFASNKEDSKKLIRDWKKYALADVIAFCKYVGIDHSKLLNSNTSKPSTSTEVYKIGSKGNGVKELQNNLIEVGFPVGKYGADGIFGNATREAVLAFQNHFRLSVDGYAGPKTQSKIKELLTKKNEKDVYRVKVDGKQVNAYREEEGIIAEVKKHVGKTDKIEIVKKK